MQFKSLDEAIECDPWIGLEQLLNDGDIDFTIRILQWLKENSTFGAETSACGFIHSCQLGLEELTKLFLTDPLKDGINVNIIFKGLPAIVAACDFHRKTKVTTKVKVVEALLQYPELNVNALSWGDTLGKAALHNSANFGDAKVISKLLLRPEIDVNVRNEAGCTPLHYACAYQLFENRRDKKEEPYGPTSMRGLKMLLSHVAIDLNPQMYGTGLTPLMVASMVTKPTVVSYLLKVPGFDIQITVGGGRFSLAYCMCHYGRFDSLKLLYSHDKEIILKKSQNGKTLLHWIAIGWKKKTFDGPQKNRGVSTSC